MARVHDSELGDVTEVIRLDLDDTFQMEVVSDEQPLWCWPLIIIGSFLYFSALASLFALAGLKDLLW